MPVTENHPKAATTEDSSRLGRFIQTYSGFLSSFVIGVAGLVATSIWQHRQSDTAQRQARSQEEIARTNADNNWRIARAEILAKNLDVLSAQGPLSADRRYGVLLSLTRGNILDPELAVSYALELGKDNPTYMRSVLESTTHKNYLQLAQAFALTCLQRFGVEKATEICKDDRLADRSDAIAQLFKDDLTKVAIDPNADRNSPKLLLDDEDDVQSMAPKLAWLFEPYLQGLYEHRRWKEIALFESRSRGARLVAALVLATARTGELLGEAEGPQIDAFHNERRTWLNGYLLGRTCDADCRAQLLEFMLSTVRESDGDYDLSLRELLLKPRAEVGRAVNTVHQRLLWCQMDPEDLSLFRDRVLVPALADALGKPRPEARRDATIIDDLVGLLALTPAPNEDQAQSRHRALLAAIRNDARLERLLVTRTNRARGQRADPPPMIRRMNFCSAANLESTTTVL